MYVEAKYILSVSSLLLFCFLSNSQTVDTIYVDQIDTVLIKEPAVILNKTYYQHQPSIKKISIITSIGGSVDFSHYESCKICEKNFNALKSSYTNTKSMQVGLQVSYIYKKLTFGIDISYRNSYKKIDYLNDTLQLNSHLSINYFMAGPCISYKVLNKSKWDIDFYTGFLFSLTTKQKGQTIGGERINEIVNINSEKIISRNNLLYHAAPSVTYNVSTLVGMIVTLHYYFDIDSNISKQESYTEQRNTIGFSVGIKYRL